MKILKAFLAISIVLFAGEIYGQELPESYQAMFNEIVTNFETITSGNSIKKSKHTLSLVNDNKIVLRTEHKKKVKNLSFIKKLDEENNLVWIAMNPLTIDMVNKYEEWLTETLMEMHELSVKKSKE